MSGASSPSVVSMGDYAPSPNTCSLALQRANQLRVQALLRQLLMAPPTAGGHDSKQQQQSHRDPSSSASSSSSSSSAAAAAAAAAAVASSPKRRVDTLRVLRRTLRELDYELGWLAQVDLFETLERLMRDESADLEPHGWRLIDDCTKLLIEAIPRLRYGAAEQPALLAPIWPKVIENLGHQRSEVRRSSLLLINLYLNERPQHFQPLLAQFIEHGLANARNKQAQRGAILSLPLLMSEQLVEGEDLLPLIRCLSEMLADGANSRLFYSLYLALQRLQLTIGDGRFRDYLQQCSPEAIMLYRQAASRSNSLAAHEPAIGQAPVGTHCSLPFGARPGGQPPSWQNDPEQERAEEPVAAGRTDELSKQVTFEADLEAAAAAGARERPNERQLKQRRLSRQRQEAAAPAADANNSSNENYQEDRDESHSIDGGASIEQPAAAAAARPTIINRRASSVSSTCSSEANLVDPSHYMSEAALSGRPLESYERNHPRSSDHSSTGLAINDLGPICNTPTMELGPGAEHELKFGILPKHLVSVALKASARLSDRLQALDEIMCIVRDSPINHLAILMTYFDSFLEQFIGRLMDHSNSDHKLELCSIDMLETIVIKTKLSTIQYIRPIVGLLVRTLPAPSDSSSSSQRHQMQAMLRDNTVRVLHKMMAYLPPQHVLDALFEHKHSRSASVREECLNRTTAALLGYDRQEFNLTKLCYHVLPMLADHHAGVRLAALECLAALAHALGPQRIGSLLTAAEAVQTGCDYDGLLDAIHARLQRRQLPRCHPDGSIGFVIKPHLQAASTLLVHQQHQLAADVRWILEAPATHQHVGAHSHPPAGSSSSRAQQQQPAGGHAHRPGLYSPPAVALGSSQQQQQQQLRRRSSLGQLLLQQQHADEPGANEPHQHHHPNHHHHHHNHEHGQAAAAAAAADESSLRAATQAAAGDQGPAAAAAAANRARLASRSSLAGASENSPASNGTGGGGGASEATPRRASQAAKKAAPAAAGGKRKSATESEILNGAASELVPTAGSSGGRGVQQQQQQPTTKATATPEVGAKSIGQTRRANSNESSASARRARNEATTRRSNSQDSSSSSDTNKVLFQYYLGKFRQSLDGTPAANATLLPSDSIIYTDTAQAYALTRQQTRQQQTSFDYDTNSAVGRIPSQQQLEENSSNDRQLQSAANKEQRNGGPKQRGGASNRNASRSPSGGMSSERASSLSPTGGSSSSVESPQTVLEQLNLANSSSTETNVDRQPNSGGNDQSSPSRRQSIQQQQQRRRRLQSEPQGSREADETRRRKSLSKLQRAAQAPEPDEDDDENEIYERPPSCGVSRRPDSRATTRPRSNSERLAGGGGDALIAADHSAAGQRQQQQQQQQQQQPGQRSAKKGELTRQCASMVADYDDQDQDRDQERRAADEAEQRQQQQQARRESRTRASRRSSQAAPADQEQQQQHQQQPSANVERAPLNEEIQTSREREIRRRASRSQPPEPRQHRTGTPTWATSSANESDGGGGGDAAGHSQERRAGADGRRAVSVSPSVASGVNIRHILENVAHVEGPFQDPQLALRVAMEALGGPCWSTKVEGMLALIRLATFHQAHLLAHLHEVISHTALETRNLRSTVARSAIFTLGDLCAKLKRSIEPELDLIVQSLLNKSIENTAFIRDDIRRALATMVEHLTQWRLANSLMTHGAAHKNVHVRRMASQFVAQLVDNMGPAKCLVGARDISGQLIPAAAKFAQDNSPHTRYYGRLIFSKIMHHGAFERLLRKNLNPNLYRSTVGIIESVKRRGAGDPPSEN